MVVSSFGKIAKLRAQHPGESKLEWKHWVDLQTVVGDFYDWEQWGKIYIHEQNAYQNVSGLGG